MLISGLVVGRPYLQEFSTNQKYYLINVAPTGNIRFMIKLEKRQLAMKSIFGKSSFLRKLPCTKFYRYFGRALRRDTTPLDRPLRSVCRHRGVLRAGHIYRDFTHQSKVPFLETLTNQKRA